MDILILSTDLKEDDFTTRNKTLKFSMDEVPVDLIISINMADKNKTGDQVKTQRKNMLQFIKNSHNPDNVAKEMSAELFESNRSSRYLETHQDHHQETLQTSRIYRLSQEVSKECFRSPSPGRAVSSQVRGRTAGHPEQEDDDVQ